MCTVGLQLGNLPGPFMGMLKGSRGQIALYQIFEMFNTENERKCYMFCSMTDLCEEKHFIPTNYSYCIQLR